MSSKIASILKSKRKELGISVKDVLECLQAHGISISDKTLYGWESGYRQPDANMLIALCQIYGITLEEISEDTGANPSYYFAKATSDRIKRKGILDYVTVETKNEAALLFAYRKATIDDKQIIDIITKKYIPADTDIIKMETHMLSNADLTDSEPLSESMKKFLQRIDGDITSPTSSTDEDPDKK